MVVNVLYSTLHNNIYLNVLYCCVLWKGEEDHDVNEKKEKERERENRGETLCLLVCDGDV